MKVEFYKPQRFVYKNYRGETAVRFVFPAALEFIAAPEYYGPERQWFLRCWDYEKRAERSFALANMQLDSWTSMSRSERVRFNEDMLNKQLTIPESFRRTAYFRD